MVTREQAAQLLQGYAKLAGKDVSASADLSKYTDSAKISNWAQSAVEWAVANNIIQGTSKTTLSPSSNATRTEAAQLMMKFCEIIK